MKKNVDGLYVINEKDNASILIGISIKELEELLKDAKKTRKDKDVGHCFLKHLSPSVSFSITDKPKAKK